jgi:hypothetical protein
MDIPLQSAMVCQFLLTAQRWQDPLSKALHVRFNLHTLYTQPHQTTSATRPALCPDHRNL